MLKKILLMVMVSWGFGSTVYANNFSCTCFYKTSPSMISYINRNVNTYSTSLTHKAICRDGLSNMGIFASVIGPASYCRQVGEVASVQTFDSAGVNFRAPKI